MFGGRGRGRGRGGGGGRNGPRLPHKLSKELFGDAAGGGRGRGRGQPPRKERRKVEREAKRGGGRGGRGGGRSASGDRRPAQPQRQQHQQRKGADQQEGRPSKRQRMSGPALPGIAAGSKFGELLPDHLKAAAGLDPEIELQRELARKLGLKRGKTKMGGEDGLDEFLDELGGIADIFEAGSDGGGAAEEAQPQQPAGRKRKQAAAAAAVDSEEEAAEEEGYSDSEGEEGSDGLDGLLDSSDEGEEEEEGEEGSLASGSSDGEGGASGGSGSEDEELGGGGSGSEEGAEEEDTEEEDSLLAGLESDGEGGSSEGEEGQQWSGSQGEEEAGASDSDAAGQQQQQQQQPAAAAAAPSAAKYVPPAARRAAAAAAGGAASEAAARVERRVRGLLNRLAEANIQGIVSDLAALYNEEGRRLVSDAVCAELIAAAAEGPRASDRFAAVTATAVAGLAGSVRSAEIVANFLDRLGARLEAAVASSDGLACHNLTMVAAHLFLSGALRPNVVHSMLDSWRERFTEADVSMIVTLLQACGLQLRAADPVAMKEFVVAVHARAGEAGGSGRLTKRAQILLELVVDVKNNRTREEAKRKAVVLAPAIGKWLKQCGAPDASVGGITWRKVLQPGKKGIWWVPEATDAQPAQLGSGAALRAAAAAAGGGGEGGLSGPELLKLAAAMRMNTDVRRAVFCVVMGSEDCVDAVEKLLRLGLKGEQEREIVRVTVDCCLQEKAWNPYYAHLLARLCGAGKSHKMTLQFCLWDQLKELDGMEVRRLTNLARLIASVLAALALPATMLKGFDFAAALTAREILFWRIFFEHLLAACKSSDDSTALFKRISAQPELKPLRVALAAFLRRSVGPWLAAKQPGQGGLSAEQLGELLRRLRGAERALGSSAA